MLSTHTILFNKPISKTQASLNYFIVSQFPGNMKVYQSADELGSEEGVDAADAPIMPVENLHALSVRNPYAMAKTHCLQVSLEG
jgi:hypothetical protein